MYLYLRVGGVERKGWRKGNSGPRTELETTHYLILSWKGESLKELFPEVLKCNVINQCYSNFIFIKYEKNQDSSSAKQPVQDIKERNTMAIYSRKAQKDKNQKNFLCNWKCRDFSHFYEQFHECVVEARLWKSMSQWEGKISQWV